MPGRAGRGGGDELFGLEEELMEAVKRRDVAYLDVALGENFVLTTGSPGVEIRSREEWLEVTRDRYRIETFGFEWMRVEAYGVGGRRPFPLPPAGDDGRRTSVLVLPDDRRLNT